MPTTQNSHPTMATPKKPASKRKAVRRAPDTTQPPVAVLQTLQTGLQRSAKTRLEEERREERPTAALSGAAKGAKASPEAVHHSFWPRGFEIPGVACRFQDTPVEVLADHLCRVVNSFSGELRRIVLECLPTCTRRAQHAADLAEMLSICAENARLESWPRTFTLPGLAQYHAMDAGELVNNLSFVVRHFEPELFDLAVQWLGTRTAEAAALSELLVICEEVSETAGACTDYEVTPLGQITPTKQLAAVAKTALLFWGQPQS